MLWKHMRTAFPPIYVRNLDRYNSVAPTETAWTKKTYHNSAKILQTVKDTTVYIAVICSVKERKWHFSPWLNSMKMWFHGLLFWHKLSTYLSYVWSSADKNEEMNTCPVANYFMPIKWQPKCKTSLHKYIHFMHVLNFYHGIARQPNKCLANACT